MDVLLVCHLIVPPPLKKERAAVAFAQVISCLNAKVHPTPASTPILLVYELDPVHAVFCVPCVSALPALSVIVLMSVAILARIAIVLPATGFVLDVIVLP